MLIPKIKENIKKDNKLKIFKKKYLIFIALIFYSYGLILLSINSDSFYKFIKTKIPLTTIMSIKDSFPYQFYKSNFSLDFPYNFLLGLSQKVDPIYLDIKYKDLNNLASKRDSALKSKVLTRSEDDYVDGILSNKDKVLKVKLRLKGDKVDHLYSDKWSFRVKTKGDKVFLGMKKFSLQSPVTRNYIWESLYHKFLRNEGLPSLRYKFRPLILNGKKLGIYAVEEHFDKILIESNKFREGPILKLSEDKYWKMRLDSRSKNDEFYKTFSTGFKLNYLNKNPILKTNFIIANKLLNEFYSKKLLTSEVFDTDLLANFFAINDLLNSKHALYWHNLRFYYDPIQAKLIPIGFDANANNSKLEELAITSLTKQNYLSFFDDNEFISKYISALERISQPYYIDLFMNNNKAQFEKDKRILFKSFPALDTKIDNIYENQEKIQQLIKPINPLNIFLEESSDSRFTLSIGNNQILPIEIKSLIINDQRIKINKLDNLVNGKKDGTFVKYKDFVFTSDKKIQFNELRKNDIKLTYNILGSKLEQYSKINIFPRLEKVNIKNLLPHFKPNFESAYFLDVDYLKKIILFKRGEYILNEPLVIPKGFKLVAEPGVKIKFVDEGLIISYSYLEFLGTKLKPIVFTSSNNKKGNGIIVLNDNKESILKNVIFKNISNIENEFWSLTGALNFYNTSVKIINCKFNETNAEDALNIVRSKFKIVDTTFNSSYSDAIDIDFSKGILKNINIRDSLGDGIDFSGSNVNGSNISIHNSKDKAISIGEGSKLKMQNIYLNKAFLGIANKDGSNTYIDGIKINDTSYSIGVFIKKPEYKNSYTILKNFKNSPSNFSYMMSNGAYLEINNKKFIPNKTNTEIIKILY